MTSGDKAIKPGDDKRGQAWRYVSLKGNLMSLTIRPAL
jgi:hypothetical protein